MKMLTIICSCLLVLASACTTSVSGKFGTQQTNANGEDDGGNTGSNGQNLDELNAGKQRLGVKNFLQIIETMESVTGLTRAANQNIRNYYDANKAALPDSNSIKLFTASHRLTIFNLAYEFCRLPSDTDQIRADFYDGTIFGGRNPQGDPLPLGSPEQVLSSQANKLELIDHLLNKFWGTYQSPDRASAEAELTDLIDYLLSTLQAGENLQSTSVTKYVMASVCTAALAAGPVILF